MLNLHNFKNIGLTYYTKITNNFNYLKTLFVILNQYLEKNTFKLIDNTKYAKILIYLFDKVIFLNDIKKNLYTRRMIDNVICVCQSKINKLIFKYNYLFSIVIPLFFINLFLIVIIYLKIKIILLYKLLTILFLLLIPFIIKINLKYIQYYHYNIYITIENKFKLEIFYITIEESYKNNFNLKNLSFFSYGSLIEIFYIFGQEKDQNFQKFKNFKFLNHPKDDFFFPNIKEIFINWDYSIQTDPFLSDIFYKELTTESEKNIQIIEKKLYDGPDTIFSIYGYHHFRYIAAKNLLNLSKHKILNTFFFAFTIINIIFV